MARFRLLAGQHIQADHNQKPTEVRNMLTGEQTETYPSRTYTQGDIVDSDLDLVARFGGQKFQLVGGEPTHVLKNEANPSEQSKAPGGQVSSGFQGGDPAKHEEMVKHAAAVVRQGNLHGKYSVADLNAKTYPQLVEIARNERIDLRGATKKDEVVKAILAAEGTPV